MLSNLQIYLSLGHTAYYNEWILCFYRDICNAMQIGTIPFEKLYSYAIYYILDGYDLTLIK